MAKAADVHDAMVKRARALAKAADGKRIASAFVVSLGEQPGFWRAPLMAVASVKHMPAHRYVPWKKDGACRECGFDPEDAGRKPSATILPGDLVSAVHALEEAKRLAKDAPKAGAADKQRLQRMLAIIGALPATAREGKLNEAWRRDKLVLGNKYACRNVIETLGACSVLETAEYPGFTTKWTTFAARQARPSVKVECDPPIAFWTAGHGVAARGLKTWFGHLGVTAPRVSKARTAERETVEQRAAASKAKKDKRAARATELVLGDAVALAVGARWIVGIVVAHFQDRGGRRAVVDLVDWSGDAPPAVDALRGRRAVGRGGVVLSDVWKREDPRERWKVVGAGVPRPAGSHLDDGVELRMFHDVAELDRVARDAGL